MADERGNTAEINYARRGQYLESITPWERKGAFAVEAPGDSWNIDFKGSFGEFN